MALYTLSSQGSQGLFGWSACKRGFARIEHAKRETSMHNAPQPIPPHTTPDPRLRLLLLAVRQACLMICGAIEAYLDLPRRHGIALRGDD